MNDTTQLHELVQKLASIINGSEKPVFVSTEAALLTTREEGLDLLALALLTMMKIRQILTTNDPLQVKVMLIGQQQRYFDEIARANVSRINIDLQQLAARMEQLRLFELAPPIYFVAEGKLFYRFGDIVNHVFGSKPPSAMNQLVAKLVAEFLNGT